MQTNRPGTAPDSIGPLYVLHFSSEHASFRLPEFAAVCTALGVPYAFVPTPDAREPSPKFTTSAEGSLSSAPSAESSPSFAACAGPSDVDPSDEWRPLQECERPYQLVHLPDDDAVRLLATRLVLLCGAYAHWTTGYSAARTSAYLASGNVRRFYAPYQNRSWKASMVSINRRMPEAERRTLIPREAESMQLDGPINLSAPELEWTWLEDWSRRQQLSKHEVRHFVRAVHVGRKVELGAQTGRALVEWMSLKRRAYIGNTSMEAEMSLIVANMALALPGTLMYDPFLGTGSLIYPCAHFGALVSGSDIDITMMRGKDGPNHYDGGVFGGRGEGSVRSGIHAAAEQYGVAARLVDIWAADVTHSPLRTLRGGLFDAIVTDPPYGVRAGAKRCGRRDVEKQRTEPYLLESGIWSHERPEYAPPMKPYPLRDLIADLLDSAAGLLVPGGRLVFWVPTMTAEGGEADGTDAGEQVLSLPTHPAFRLVAQSLQDFGRWGRRLITMELLPEDARSQASQPIGLPQPPAAHMRGAAKTKPGRLRADQDPTDFRNKFYRNISVTGDAGTP